MHEIDRIVAACRELMDAGRRGVAVTIVRTEGSTYRRAGARAVIGEDGSLTGAISGGCLERDLAERIRPWLADLTPRLTLYDSTREEDRLFGLGLGCRGVVELLVEPFDAGHPPQIAAFRWNGREPVEWTTRLPGGETVVEVVRPPRAVVIFGTGNDAIPVVRLCTSLGWNADLVSRREPLDVDGYDAAVVMTHNFDRDADLLRQLFASRIGYIGLLGPRTRGDELLASIGATREPRLHNPIGLDLGGETPEEIALAIAAEINAVLAGRSARPLRELDTPIHEPRAFPTCA